MYKISVSFFLLLSLLVNAQASWQTLSGIVSNTNNRRFDDIFFINNDLGWAVNGASAAIFKTTDGGLTWSEQLNETDLGGNYYFRNVEFLDQNIGFIGTLNNLFLKTTDGGTNWTTVNNISPNPQAICGLETIGNSTIYGCGAYFTPAYIIKSEDSGNTWQYIDMSAYANALVEITFLTEDIGFAAGRSDSGAVILKTTNGGTSWTEIFNSNIIGEYVWKLQILDSDTDIMFGAITSVAPNPGGLITTVNGGSTWTTYNAPETDIQAVGFIDQNTGWMGGHNTGFYETTNGGQSWTNLNIGSNLNRIFIINSTLAYASGTTLYKFTEGTLSAGDFQEKDRTPLKVQLKNNPVQDLLEFNIEFTSDDHILIELYDIHGKFIKQLVRDRTNTKTTRRYSCAVKHLSPGTYLVNLHNNTGRASFKFIKE